MGLGQGDGKSGELGLGTDLSKAVIEILGFRAVYPHGKTNYFIEGGQYHQLYHY